MRSIKFPKMFDTTSTRVWKASEYLESTKQNTKLVLKCERGELIGDPYFGLMLRHFFFEQNNYILRDQIIDMIYVQLATFIPQIKIERKDITITKNNKKGMLYCEFSGINQIDYTLNTYQLILFKDTETSK